MVYVGGRAVDFITEQLEVPAYILAHLLVRTYQGLNGGCEND